MDAVAVLAAEAGDGLAALFGLNKSNIVFVAVGDGLAAGETAAVVFPLCIGFSAGAGDVAGVSADDVDAAPVVAVLRERLGRAEGEALAEGDAFAVVSAFLCDGFLAGDAAADASGEAEGEAACA